MKKTTLLVFLSMISYGTCQMYQQYLISLPSQVLNQGASATYGANTITTPGEVWTLVIDVNFTECKKSISEIEYQIYDLTTLQNRFQEEGFIAANQVLETELTSIKTRWDSIKYNLVNIQGYTYSAQMLPLYNYNLEKINSDLSHLKPSTEVLQHAVEAKATLLDGTNELANKSAEAIQDLNKSMKIIKDELNDIETILPTFGNLSRHLSPVPVLLLTHCKIMRLAMENVDAELWKLNDAFVSAVNRRLGTSFMPTMKFYEILSKIQTKLPESLTFLIPLQDNIINQFYEFVTARIKVWEESYRIYIDIPLKSAFEEYAPSKSIPVPIIMRNQVVSPCSRNGINIPVMDKSYYETKLNALNATYSDGIKEFLKQSRDLKQVIMNSNNHMLIGICSVLGVIIIIVVVLSYWLKKKLRKDSNKCEAVKIEINSQNVSLSKDKSQQQKHLFGSESEENVLLQN